MRTTVIETAGWVTGKAINIATPLALFQAHQQFRRERSLLEVTAAFDRDGLPCLTEDETEDVIRITVQR